MILPAHFQALLVFGDKVRDLKQSRSRKTYLEEVCGQSRGSFQLPSSQEGVGSQRNQRISYAALFVVQILLQLSCLPEHSKQPIRYLSYIKV